MATLLLRLAGPLQAWGAESKFEQRRTLGYPTKSGVIGMLAAALGLSRDESPEKLNALRFGIRIDREGEYLRDYHTAHGRADKEAYITERYYLADAVFLVGLESDDTAWLKEIEYAFRHPVYPLYLGRRACPPTMPLICGIRNTGLLTALQEEPWLLAEWRQKRSSESERKLRIMTDADSPNGAAPLRDLALSYSQKHRQHVWRLVKEHPYVQIQCAENDTVHDAFSEAG